MADETDATGLHQGVGRHDIDRAGRLCDHARHGRRRHPGLRGDGAAQGPDGRSGQGRLGRLDLPGLHAVVRDPDLRAGRARGARARQPAVEDQPWLRLPARTPDPTAGVRPRSRQGADEAHQPRQGPRRRPEVGADHLGRGTGHRRREDDGTAPQQRGAQAGLHARPLFADVHRPPLRHVAADLRHHQLLLAQRDLRRSREDGTRAHAGLLRLSRLRPREDQLPRGLGLRPARLQPAGPEYDPPLPRDRRARHGDHRRPAAFEFRRQVPRVAADQARNRRRARGRHCARPADRRPVEPRVRRRLQGRQERVRHRPHRGRGRVRREGDERHRQVVEPRAQGQDPGVGREGNPDSSGADRQGGPRDGQGRVEDRRVDGSGRGDEPARHLRRDGRARAERHRRLDRRRRRRLAVERRHDGRVPEVGCLSRRRRQGRRQVQEARRSRRQGHAGDDERPARQRRRHQQRRQRHAEGPRCGQGVPRVVGELQLLVHRRRPLGQGNGPVSRSSCTWSPTRRR